MASRWEQAWNDAEPRLKTWMASWSHANVLPRVLRVGQLDAELLDEELVHILQEPLEKALGFINAGLRSRVEPELALILRLTLYKSSMWDLGATYGAKLQDLRYRYQNTHLGSLAPSGLPKRLLVCHALLTVLLPYFHTRLRNHALSNAWPDTPSSDKRRKAWNIVNNVESVHSAASLLSFVMFLWSGRYRTLADRILSLQLVPSRRFTNRQVSYEFMNRQMVWHAFTEFLLLILPVFASPAFRRTYNQVISRIRAFNWNSVLPSTSSNGDKKVQKPIRVGRFFGLPDDQCALCAENTSGLSSFGASNDQGHFVAYLESAASLPIRSLAHVEGEQNSDGPPTHPITTPYRASCGHIYCYVCLSEKLLRAIDDGEDGWTCLRCMEIVRSCERVDAICVDDFTRTSEGWASEIEEPGSFESDMDMSLCSEQSHF